MIPSDPIILLSYINTQLRDFYDSLDSFCDDKDADKQEIIDQLGSAGFSYDADKNQFR